jgi:hypothetical protein
VRYLPIVGHTKRCLLALLSTAGCATAAVPSPPEARHATPITVTKENPAGDAREPEDAALTRLLDAPTGTRFDRFHTLMASYPDVGNWRRVRIFGHPTRVTYRYGDDHFAIDAVEYKPAEGDDTPAGCLERFVEKARSEAQRYTVEIGPVERGEGRSQLEPMPWVRVSGAFTSLFKRDRYFGAVAAYRSWPGTCLVRAMAVRVGTDESLARKVVDRWVDDLAPDLRWVAHVRNAPPFADR